MADKYHSDTQEQVKVIAYNPSLQDSGDLEAVPLLKIPRQC